MASILVFIAGAALLIYSAEKLVGYLVGVASGLRVSVFLLAIVFTGIEFDDIFLGSVLNLEDLDGVALGIVFGTALSLPGIVLALAVILKPIDINIPRNYVVIFAVAPLVMVVFTLMAPLNAVHGVILLGLFVLFLAYVAVRETRGEVPVFRDVEMQETFAAAQRARGGTSVLTEAKPGVNTPESDIGNGFSSEGKDQHFPEHALFVQAREFSSWAGIGLAVLALAGIIVGAAVTGIGIEGILEAYGLEGTIFGATILTVVLTIEDIFLTVQPVRKGSPEIGIGNIIGSVVFSVTGKLGFILLAGGLVVGPNVLSWHLPTLLALTWLAAYFLSTGRLKRGHGYTLLSLYIVYWVVSFVGFGTVPVEMD